MSVRILHTCGTTGTCIKHVADAPFVENQEKEQKEADRCQYPSRKCSFQITNSLGLCSEIKKREKIIRKSLTGFNSCNICSCKDCKDAQDLFSISNS